MGNGNFKIIHYLFDSITEKVHKVIMRDKLTPKQAMFCIEYLKDQNGTQAAIRAGYSKDTAAEIASQNLTKLNIQEVIQEHLDARATRELLTADRILHEMYSLANVDPNEVFDENGDLKPIKDIPLEVRKAIASIEVEAIYEMEGKGRNRHKVEIGQVKKIKFWDKGRAQENLAKHLKLFVDDEKAGERSRETQIIIIRDNQSPTLIPTSRRINSTEIVRPEST